MASEFPFTIVRARRKWNKVQILVENDFPPRILQDKLLIKYEHRLLPLPDIWNLKNLPPGASLVAQWLRICLPMQVTRVRALVWEDPTCRGAVRPVSHNYWACASGACAPQQESPRQWEARAPQEWPPLAATRESPRIETKTQHSHK